LEMSRQRLRPSLGETSAIVCPRCTGQGSIRDTKSLALSILRLLEEAAIKDRSVEVRAIVPVDVAAYLLNEKRAALSEIELVSKSRILVIPNPNLDTPHFEVQRLRDDEVDGDHQTSYKVDVTVPDAEAISDTHSADIPVQQAVVQAVAPKAAPAPQAPTSNQSAAKPQEDAKPATADAAAKPGLMSRLWGAMFAAPEEEPAAAPVVEQKEPERVTQSNERQGQKPQNNRNRSRRLQRLHAAVVVDPDVLHQAGRRATAPDPAELRSQVIDRLLHALFGLEQNLVVHLTVLRRKHPCD
jgi:ribonuclease E